MRDALARTRGAWYRLRAQWSAGRIVIGANLRAYCRLSIRGPGRVTIGRGAIVAAAPGFPSEYVTLYTHDAEAVISIGDNVRLHGARFSSRHTIVVGDGVLIEQAGITDTDFHSLDRDRGAPRGESRERSAIVIGDHVAIAAMSIVTKGVRIGEGTAVGPGSIVVRSLPPGVFAIGNPARVIDGSNSQ